MTESLHGEHFDRRAVLDDLSEKTDHRHPVFLTQTIHATQLQVRYTRTHVGKSRHHLVFKWFDLTIIEVVEYELI